MLKMKNINVTLGKGTQLERLTLKDINLTINHGEFIVVIGGNGAGKSTLLNTISGFVTPDSGKIIIDGLDAFCISPRSRAALVSKVAQDPRAGTMENMTVAENMAFAYSRGKIRGLSPFLTYSRNHVFKDRLSQLGMGLEARLNELVVNLSGGQRQALSLIMASLVESKILLLDEITASLDPQVSETVMKLANEIIKEAHITCIMITHNMHHAIKYGSRLLVLKEGMLVREFSGKDKRSLTERDLLTEFNGY